MKQIAFFTLIISLIVVWGCNKDQSPISDEQTLNEIAVDDLISEVEASEDDDYFYASLDDESENYFVDFGPGGTSLAKQIIPLRFGRIARRPIPRDAFVRFTSDTTAVARIRLVMRGKFRILAADTSYNDSLVHIYPVNKRLGHEFWRIAHFAKRGTNNDSKRGWKLVKFSMVLGESFGWEDSTRVKTDLNIVKLIVQSDSVDLTITDPLNYFQTKKSVFAFEPGTSVTLTVHIDNGSLNPYVFPAGTQATELVRLHHARHRKLRKHGIKRFEWIGQDAGGNNIY